MSMNELMHTEQNLNFLENSIYFFLFFFPFSELLSGSLTPTQPHCSLSFPVTAVRFRVQITPHGAGGGIKGWGGGGFTAYW